MAFSEIELKKIEKFVGGLCNQKTPEKYKNELRFEYRIKDHDVIIYEIRSRWGNPQEVTELPFAKLKFNRTKIIGCFIGNGQVGNGNFTSQVKTKIIFLTS